MESVHHLTDQALIDAWLAWLRSPEASRRLGVRTQAAYEQQLRGFMQWLQSAFNIPLSSDSVTAYRLEVYLEYLSKGLNRAPATQTVAVAALRLFARWLHLVTERTDDPTRHLRAQPEHPRVPRALSRTILRRVLDAAHQPGIALRDTLIIEMLATSGMRVSELTRLRIEDLERGQRTLWATITGKGNKRRRIALPKRVGALVDRYLEQRAEDGVRPTHGPLLLGQRGALTRSTINRVVDAVVQRAKLSEAERRMVTPHAFRHTVATRLAQTYGITLAADVLGHANLNTTRRYIAITEDDLEAAAATLDERW